MSAPRPRVLLVSGRYPYPLRDGSDRRVAQIGRALAGFETHLLADQDEGEPSERRFEGDGFAAVHAVTSDGPRRSWRGRLAGRFLRPKFDDPHFRVPSLIARARELHAERPLAAVLIETLRYGWLFDSLADLRPSPIHAIDAVDIWHERYRHYVAMGKGRVLDHFRDPGREMARYRAADLTLAISTHDRDAMLAAAVPEDRLLYLPVAFEPQPVASVAEGPELLFAGVSGEANEEAAVWFADSVLPRVRARVPGARLTLLRVPETIGERFAGRDDVRTLPFIDDIDDAYRAARVVVVPLLRGTGIKIKVLEAFSRGAAAIITPAAAQGIELAEYAQERITEDPAALAAEVTRALTSEEYRRALGASGLAIVAERYRPERVYAPLADRLRGLTENRSAAGAQLSAAR